MAAITVRGGGLRIPMKKSMEDAEKRSKLLESYLRHIRYKLQRGRKQKTQAERRETQERWY